MSDFNGTGSFSTDFRKIDKMTDFFKNPSSGYSVVARGRTDGHDEGNSRFFFL